MIDILFYFGSEVVLTRIDGDTLYLASGSNGDKMAPFDEKHVKLNYSGVIKEFPDLEGSKNWSSEAVRRFKEKFKSYKTEEEKARYVISDLSRHGYIPKYKQKRGFRIEML
jgi:hypothetical protein